MLISLKVRREHNLDIASRCTKPQLLRQEVQKQRWCRGQTGPWHLVQLTTMFHSDDNNNNNVATYLPHQNSIQNTWTISIACYSGRSHCDKDPSQLNICLCACVRVSARLAQLTCITSFSGPPVETHADHHIRKPQRKAICECVT